MRRSAIGTCLVIVAGMFFALRETHAQIAPCGQQLSTGAIYLGVPALSNGGNQGSDASCETNVKVACSIGMDGGNDGTNPACSYGQHFQCVEYVRRFYSLRSDTAERVDTSSWAGLDAFNSKLQSGYLASSNGTVTSKLAGFVAFANGGNTPPLPSDIIVFSGGGYGHVAIVQSVTATQVETIEENFNYSGLYKLSYSQASNMIAPRPGRNGAVFTVVGWLREASAIQNNPVPAISALNPNPVLAGSNGQTLVINGTGFLTSSTVTFNGMTYADTFVSSTQLTISLSTGDLSQPGTFPVVVTNPGPGGGPSNTTNFTVNNSAPSISSLSPSSLPAGSAAQTLTINGAGFISNSSVTFNGIAEAATFVSANQLTMFLSSSDLSTAGTFPVVVANPAGGGTSNGSSFSVINGQNIGMWTWEAGSETINQGSANGAVYGTQGVPAASNTPGSVYGSVTWADTNNDLWLFAGVLWEYNPSSGMWAWIKGDSSGSPSYGSLGVPDATNAPSARSSAAGWRDQSGNLWLFGGDGLDSTRTSSVLNDLWKYNIAANVWTWIGGADIGDQSSNYGTQGVPANTNDPGSRTDMASWVDNDGNFWLFGGDVAGGTPNTDMARNDLWKYSPASGQWTWVSGSGATDSPGVYGTLGVGAVQNVPGARIDAVAWADSNGNLWLFGGGGYDATGTRGNLNDLWKYNIASNTWTWIAGSSSANPEPGVYGQRGIASSANTPGKRAYSMGWIDKNGNLWLFGGTGYDSTGANGPLNDLWKFDIATGEWVWIGGSNTAWDAGSFGSLGVPSPTNRPGSRIWAETWTDSAGYFWLYGGVQDNSNTGYLSDLWQYQPQ